MAKLRPNVAFVFIVMLAVITLPACTRSASTPPAATEGALPSGSQSETQATMDAVRAAILTQTAQASEGGAAPEATQAPTEEAAPAEPTATPGTPEPTATPKPEEGVLEYTVQPGDWIFKIARNFGVDPQAIIDLNELASPGQLVPGMVLKIPTAGESPPAGETTAATPVEGGTVHVVQPGEWIWQIARLYGVDPQAIIDANNLTSPSTIYPGQELIIP